jgi:uncharacterized protein YndB with AHSA1/START domain
MTDAFSQASTRNSKWIKATPEALYRVFTDPAALAVWQAPGDMTGKVHRFDYRVGGGYQMSLYYPLSETTSRGKTREREDRYTARFVELTPPRKIVEAITFDAVDPAFEGVMIMEVTFEAENEGTNVSMFFKDIPAGIRPEDNEAGTQSSLEKLARYVEGDGKHRT